MKLSAATIALLGIAAGAEVTEALLEEKINATVNGLQSQVDTLKPDAELGKQLLTETRARAVTLYKTAKGEKIVETFIAGVIEKSDLATARALCQEYAAEVDKTIPLKCPKCGEALSRRSSHQAGDSGQHNGKRTEDYKL